MMSTLTSAMYFSSLRSQKLGVILCVGRRDLSPNLIGSARKSLVQLPCRSAEVNFFSVFLCEIWREILVKCSVLRFPGIGYARENFTEISRQKRCEKRKISRKLHSAGAQCSKVPSAETTERDHHVMWGTFIFPNPPHHLMIFSGSKGLRSEVLPSITSRDGFTWTI